MTKTYKHLLLVIPLTLLSLAIWWGVSGGSKSKELSYTELTQLVSVGQVATAEFTDDGVRGELTDETTYVATLNRPEIEAELARSMQDNAVRIVFKPSDRTWSGFEVTGLVFLAVFLAAMVGLLGARLGASPGKYSKSIVRAATSEELTTDFRNVAGYEHVKRDLLEMVQALQMPKIFEDLGTEPPRTVLLLGPPGTGKTQLARAVAKAAGASFFAGNGAEFVEMFVGVGPGRMRDLFLQARERVPAVIFVDEVDAVARRRGTALTQAHEHDHTLNQLLVELDGFWKVANRRVIFMAATNRDDVLDSAFLQRMNRRIVVALPNHRERRLIIRKHAPAENFELSEEDLLELATQTAGMSGRELEALTKDTVRERYQRLVDEFARDREPDRHERTLWYAHGTPSPVPLAGGCPKGASISIDVGANTITTLDDDEDGRWQLALAAPVGKHTVSARWNSDGQSWTSKTFEICVESGKHVCTMRDFRAALAKGGVRLPSPATLLGLDAELARQVHEQTAAQLHLTRAASLHYARCRSAIDRNPCSASNAVVLLGGTGVGKSHALRTLANHLGVAHVIVDAPGVLDGRTIDGCLEELLRRLLRAANGSPERAGYGLLSIQNLHELPPTVLPSLLQVLTRLLGGERIEVSTKDNAVERSHVVIDTQGIFVAMEANLPRVEDKARQRARLATARTGNVQRVEPRVLPLELVEIGFGAALAERLAAQTSVWDDLSASALSEIASAKMQQIRKEYETFWTEMKQDLHVVASGFDAVGTLALGRRAGGHSVEALLHEVLGFAIRTSPRGASVIVDEALVYAAVDRTHAPGARQEPCRAANEKEIVEKLAQSGPITARPSARSNAPLDAASWLRAIEG